MSAGSVIQRTISVPFNEIDSSGARTAYAGVSAVADATRQFADQMGKAKSEQDLVDARLSATKQLDDLQQSFRTDEDPSTAAQRFADEARKIGDQASQNLGPDARNAFTADFGQMAESRRMAVSDFSFKRQADQFGASLDDTIETNTRTAALAANPAERASALSNIEKALQGGVSSGWIDAQSAQKQMQTAHERLSLYDGRAALLADPAGLLKNLKKNDYLPDLDPLARVELSSQAEAEIRARQREAHAALAENRLYATQAIDDLREAGASGLPVAPETIDAARNAIRAAGNDPRLVQHYSTVMSGLSVAGSLRGANSQEVSGALQGLAAEANAHGATPEMSARYKAGITFQNRMDAALKNDPLSWANDQGVVKLQPLALNGTDAPAAWAGRVQAAKAAAQRYHTAPRFLTAAEEDALKVQLANGTPDQKLGIIQTLAHGLGSNVTSVFARLAPQDPSFATAAGLALQGGAHIATARDVLAGQHLLNEKGSDLAPSSSVRGQGTKGASTGWFGGYNSATIGAGGVRQAFSLVPDEGGRVLSAADAIYAARAARTGLNAKDNPDAADELYARSAQEAAGAHFDANGRQFGGISTYRGHPIVVPPTVAADGFEDVVHHLTESDLAHASVTGAAPDLKGHAVSDLWLVSAGDGRYALSTTDPATGDVTPIRDRGGKPYRLDFLTASAALRARAGAK